MSIEESEKERCTQTNKDKKQRNKEKKKVRKEKRILHLHATPSGLLG